MTTVDDRDDAHREAPAWLGVVTSPILLAGIYAWSVAVAPAGSIALGQLLRGGVVLKPLAALAATALCPLALIAGVLLERRRARSAPALGVWAFLALAVGAWLLAPASVDAGRVDALRGLLATSGFVLYGLAWGVPDVFRRTPPEDNPRAELSAALPPRDQLPAAALPVAGTGILAAAGLFFFSWRVQDGPRSLLAHAAAGLASVLLLSAAAEVALRRRGWTAPRPTSRLRRASGALALLVLLAAVAVAHALVTR